MKHIKYIKFIKYIKDIKDTFFKKNEFDIDVSNVNGGIGICRLVSAGCVRTLVWLAALASLASLVSLASAQSLLKAALHAHDETARAIHGLSFASISITESMQSTIHVQ